MFPFIGHVKLQRLTAIEREERKRIEKKEKKEKDEEEERNRLTYNFVKYTLGLKHQVNSQLILWGLAFFTFLHIHKVYIFM